MHSSYASFPLLTSILTLTAAVRPHPQVPEPSTAFPLENSGIKAHGDTEDVGFGTPWSLKAFPLDGDHLTGVEQFLSSTSGSVENGNGVEIEINHPEILLSDVSSHSSDEENIISQGSACDQRSNSPKSRRLRNRNPGQKLPSLCSANPIEKNPPSVQQIKPNNDPSGTDNWESNEGKNIPVDVPEFIIPTEGKDFMGTSTIPKDNPEICPPDRLYPLCADDNAISAVPQGIEYLFTEVRYMLNPAYAYNPFFRCAFPEILWCCMGFASVILRDPTENNPPLIGLACLPHDPTHVIDPATVKRAN